MKYRQTIRNADREHSKPARTADRTRHLDLQRTLGNQGVLRLLRAARPAQNDEDLPRAEEAAGNAREAAPSLENRIGALRGGGTPLNDRARSFFERRLGHDLSGVRVHHNAGAAGLARSVNARAFTVGRDIVFGAGEYQPQSSPGRRLLAHELAHVVQQSAGATMLQRMAPCPTHLAASDPVPSGWKPYYGDACVFHCCYRGILENRKPSQTDPMNECFYDEEGTLVDDKHPFSGCKGTPDYFDSKTQTWDHIWNDPGGIWHSGGKAFWESRGHPGKPVTTRKHIPFNFSIQARLPKGQRFGVPQGSNLSVTCKADYQEKTLTAGVAARYYIMLHREQLLADSDKSALPYPIGKTSSNAWANLESGSYYLEIWKDEPGGFSPYNLKGEGSIDVS
jgi:hypothetical protein